MSYTVDFQLYPSVTSRLGLSSLGIAQLKFDYQLIFTVLRLCTKTTYLVQLQEEASKCLLLKKRMILSTPPNSTSPNSSRDMMQQLQDTRAGGAKKVGHKTTVLSQQVSEHYQDLTQEHQLFTTTKFVFPTKKHHHTDYSKPCPLIDPHYLIINVLT